MLRAFNLIATCAFGATVFLLFGSFYDHVPIAFGKHVFVMHRGFVNATNNMIAVGDDKIPMPTFWEDQFVVFDTNIPGLRLEVSCWPRERYFYTFRASLLLPALLFGVASVVSLRRMLRQRKREWQQAADKKSHTPVAAGTESTNPGA